MNQGWSFLTYACVTGILSNLDRWKVNCRNQEGNVIKDIQEVSRNWALDHRSLVLQLKIQSEWVQTPGQMLSSWGMLGKLSTLFTPRGFVLVWAL